MQILVIDPHDNGVEHEVAASAGSDLDVDSEPVRHPMLNLKPNPTRASMVSIWIRTTESTVDRLAVLAQTESIFDVVLVTLWKSWKQVRQQSIPQMEYVCSGKW